MRIPGNNRINKYLFSNNAASPSKKGPFDTSPNIPAFSIDYPSKKKLEQTLNQIEDLALSQNPNSKKPLSKFFYDNSWQARIIKDPNLSLQLIRTAFENYLQGMEYGDWSFKQNFAKFAQVASSIIDDRLFVPSFPKILVKLMSSSESAFDDSEQYYASDLGLTAFNETVQQETMQVIDQYLSGDKNIYNEKISFRPVVYMFALLLDALKVDSSNTVVDLYPNKIGAFIQKYKMDNVDKLLTA